MRILQNKLFKRFTSPTSLPFTLFGALYIHIHKKTNGAIFTQQNILSALNMQCVLFSTLLYYRKFFILILYFFFHSFVQYCDLILLGSIRPSPFQPWPRLSGVVKLFVCPCTTSVRLYNLLQLLSSSFDPGSSPRPLAAAVYSCYSRPSTGSITTVARLQITTQHEKLGHSVRSPYTIQHDLSATNRMNKLQGWGNLL